jgi:hypothetical protein
MRHWGVLVLFGSGTAFAQTKPPPDLHISDDGRAHIDLDRGFELELLTPAQAFENVRRELAEWVLDPQAFNEELITRESPRLGSVQIKPVTTVSGGPNDNPGMMIYLPIVVGHFGGRREPAGEAALPRRDT